MFSSRNLVFGRSAASPGDRRQCRLDVSVLIALVLFPLYPEGMTVPCQMQRHLLGISLTMPEQRPSPARDTERADHPRRRPPSPSTIPLRSPAEPRTPAPDGVRKVSQQSVSLPGKLVGPFSRGQRGMGDARAGPRPPRTTRPRPPRRPQAWAGSASRTQH